MPDYLHYRLSALAEFRCAGDDEQLLVVALELLVGILAEIAGMGVLAVNEKDCALDFTGIRQERHIEEGQ